MSTAQAPKGCSYLWGAWAPWEIKNNGQIPPKLLLCRVFFRGAFFALENVCSIQNGPHDSKSTVGDAVKLKPMMWPLCS